MNVGTKVRLRDLESFNSVVRSKCGNGRVGNIVGFTSWGGVPIVSFPALGRKKEFLMGQVRMIYLEVVE